jgi:murein DD-endopeptidase MepM/ murein hydrolase activator NlpD
MRLLVSILLIVSTCGVVGAQNLMVYPQKDDNKNSLSLQVYNKFPCPITLRVQSAELDTTFQTFMPKESDQTLFIWQDPPKEMVENIEKFEYNFILGDPDAIHNDRYQYNLPYPRGEAYILAQGNKTEHTHNEIISEYAFDFAMPVGSLVSAARGGVVGYVVDKYSVGGNDISLKEKTNRIIICHEDGTVAAYGHLKKDGAFVEVGDIVYAEQVIGRSGNTGYSTFPHLHFVVLKGRRSIPIRFRNQYTILYEGQLYKHEE